MFASAQRTTLLASDSEGFPPLHDPPARIAVFQQAALSFSKSHAIDLLPSCRPTMR
jgi:hypothetical protein